MFRNLDELKGRGVYRQTFVDMPKQPEADVPYDDYGVFEVRRSEWDGQWQPWHGMGTESDPMMCLEQFGYKTKAQAVEVLERWLNDVLIVERQRRADFRDILQIIHQHQLHSFCMGGITTACLKSDVE
jgi:hypothetical protein